MTQMEEKAKRDAGQLTRRRESPRARAVTLVSDVMDPPRPASSCIELIRKSSIDIKSDRIHIHNNGLGFMCTKTFTNTLFECHTPEL